jgi:Fe2+ transport system protein FeoA
MLRAKTEEDDAPAPHRNLLVLGARVQIISSAPFDGPISVRVAGAVHALDRRLARMILIEE